MEKYQAIITYCPNDLPPASIVGRLDDAGRFLRNDGTLWLFAPVATDLTGLEWRVAFALRDAGWWLRSEIIITHGDAPYSRLFLLAKRSRYIYDWSAIAVRSKTAGKRYRRSRIYPPFAHEVRSDGGRLANIQSKPTRPRRAVWADADNPVELAVLASTDPGDMVMDPFGINRHTAETCERLSRVYVVLSDGLLVRPLDNDGEA